MSDEAKENEFGPFRILTEERAARLESVERNALSAVATRNERIQELRSECARLRAALEFYADRASHRPRGLGENPKTPAEDDRGRRARKALGWIP